MHVQTLTVYYNPVHGICIARSAVPVVSGSVTHDCIVIRYDRRSLMWTEKLMMWSVQSSHGCIYIFFWILYWPRMLINILWHPLNANQYGGPQLANWIYFQLLQRTMGLSCFKPITTKHQSVFWLVSQSRRMSAICVGSCRWNHLRRQCCPCESSVRNH